MSNTKQTITNQIKLWLFCMLIGAVAGAVVWIFLKMMAVGIDFLWDWIPSRLNWSCYPLVICVGGALLIGLFRKKFGDYPEELESVMATVKTEKHYDYSNMLIMLLAALFPLLIGSSVGPEAGMTGVIVGLCYWVGDNLKFAGKNTKDYSKLGMAVSLSVLFCSPLFGIFQVEEEKNGEVPLIDKSSKIITYGLAIVAGTGAYAGLSALFGAGLGGLPSFESTSLSWQDFCLMIVYILSGILMALLFEGSHKFLHNLAERIPIILKEVIAGLCIGVAAMVVPISIFSGEDQMIDLMQDYASYLPIALIGIGILKVLLTNLCIQFGLKGGHFFPLIFAGVAMGYGIALMAFQGDVGHAAFGAAVVTAALLGATMKKPFAVTMLLFLCFPVKMLLWIFIAATIGSKCISLISQKSGKTEVPEDLSKV